jgi:hypothetical protein
MTAPVAKASSHILAVGGGCEIRDLLVLILGRLTHRLTAIHHRNQLWRALQD